ncbi:MAG: zinc-dependent metalloprotease [Actinomycetota bacterium]|nr:zinc-dependent metalloprotease [Actinomycetota bacterium]
MIDWRLAQQLATFVAGEGNGSKAAARAAAPSFPALAEIAATSERVVSQYTGLRVPSGLPAAEAVSRAGWIEANVRSLPAMLEPLTERVGERLGPLAPTLQSAAGAVIAGEVGVLFGYMARHVLGQYEVVLLDPDAPARLLFVAPNLEEAALAFKADRDELLTWVALHEITHGLQFGGVPWLRDHLAGLVRELLGSVEVSLDASRLLRLPSVQDLRGFVAALRSGDLLTLVTRPEQRELIDRIQVTMSVLEGYAEHVMDAVGATVLTSLPALRAAMQRRRESRSGIGRVLARLLGIELKLRQYENGKRFCDAVVEQAGIGTLNGVWQAPDMLPTPDELAAPAAWIERTRVLIVTKS